MEVFDLQSSASEGSLSFINQLVYEAVQKRHRGLILGLRCPNSTPIILAVRVQEVQDHPPRVTAIDAFLPMNAPQPASSVAWTAHDLVRAPQRLISQSEDITTAVVAHLNSRSSTSCDRGQAVECDAPVTTAKFTLQLVFFDADARPLFVTATSGILSVDEFDDTMCARRTSNYLSASRSLPPPPSAAFGAESPDWQEAVPSDSDEPWF